MGFDINEKYINTAKRRFKDRGEFVCAALQGYNTNGETPFDIVLATGILHHLDDDTCNTLFRLAYKSLRLGGRLITLDGVFTPHQNLLKRFFVSAIKGSLSSNRKSILFWQKPALETCNKQFSAGKFVFLKAIFSSNGSNYMTSKEQKKIFVTPAVLCCICCGLNLFNGGICWDDWWLVGQDKETLRTMFSAAGFPGIGDYH